MKKEVFIVGSKGIPAKYGGFESFVENLTMRKVSTNLHYFVACREDLSENKAHFFSHNNATCYNVSVPPIGPARAILYDLKAIDLALKIIEKKNISQPIIYVLACRIGPFIHYYKKKLKKYNGQLFVNPDGHEYLRAKWNFLVRKYWKLSERLMVKNSDLLICDSQNIEKYIQQDYAKYNPSTEYIAYGSEVKKSSLSFSDKIVKDWFNHHGITLGNYYLIVGRFVPENNYETMIKEYME